MSDIFGEPGVKIWSFRQSSFGSARTSIRQIRACYLDQPPNAIWFKAGPEGTLAVPVVMFDGTNWHVHDVSAPALTFVAAFAGSFPQAYPRLRDSAEWQSAIKAKT